MFIFVIYRDSTIFLIKTKVAYVVNLVVLSYATFVYSQCIFEKCPISALYLQKVYSLFLVVFELNYDLNVVFLVGFRNFCKNKH